MIICSCFGVSLSEIHQIIKDDGPKTTDDIIERTKMTLSCGCCKEQLEKIIKEYNENPRERA